MKDSLKMLLVLSLIVLVLPVIFLTSCGSDEPNNATTAPATGSIVFSPTEVPLEVGPGTCDEAVSNISDEPVVVTVRDVNGNPQNHITIYVGLDWSPTTSTAVGARLLDADLNPPVEVSVPYKTKTGDHGTKNLILRMDIGGCEYAGQLTAISGTLYGAMEFEVTAQ